MRPYKPYIPKNIHELMSQLTYMLIKSPTFESSEFPGRSIETAFLQLNEGLKMVRAELGEDRFQALMTLSDRMRGHFEADPTNSNGQAKAGRQLVFEMEGILKTVSSPRVQPASAEVKLTREEIIDLVRRLIDADGDRAELEDILDELLRTLPDADVGDLIYRTHPELTVEEIVDEALRRQRGK